MIKTEMVRLVQMILVVVLLNSCQVSQCPESPFEGITLQLVEDNPLRVSVAFTVKDHGQVTIRYWPTDNSNIARSSELQVEGNNRVTISRLSPNTEYSFILDFATKDCDHQSAVHTIKTGQAPGNITPLTWELFDPAAYEGYLLAYRRTPRGNIHLIDRNGDIVWYEKVDGMVKVAHWTKNQTLLALYGNNDHQPGAGSDIIELNLDGEKLLHLKLDTTQSEAHHEVRFDSEGSIVALTYDTRNYDLSQWSGTTNQSVTADGITRYDRDGKVLWQWSVLDHKNPAVDTTSMKHFNDWGHANSLSFDSDGNYLVSFRQWNQVWKIDRESGRVIWKFGENGDYKIDISYSFSGQHAAHINQQGDLMLFDNGLQKHKSRILSFFLDDGLLLASTKMNFELPESSYSDVMGSAYIIDGNNILVCASRAKQLLILDPNGEIISEAYMGVPEPYRVEYIPPTLID